MGRILILVNHEVVVYNFRKELVETLLENEHNVIISCPKGEKINHLVKLGAIHVHTKIDRRGTNIYKDLKLFFKYFKIISTYKPDVILSFTIKPNIYGGIVSKIKKIPILINVTGLGTSIEKKSKMQSIIVLLYKYALKNAKVVFFQNYQNMDFMIKGKQSFRKYYILPGSGVNIDSFKFIKYPNKGEIIKFIFVGRIMKAKGIDFYLELAKTLRIEYENLEFHVIGGYEEDYKHILKEYQDHGFIKYHGKLDDVKDFYAMSHAIIHPTFHEGMSNVLLEAAATGRPLIASKIPGCMEIIDENINGIFFEPQNQESLNNAVKKFIALSYEEKNEMGKQSRFKIEKEFDRKTITNIYIDEIRNIVEDKKWVYMMI